MGATAIAAGIASVDAGLQGTALSVSERVTGHLSDAVRGELTASSLAILLAVGAIGVAVYVLAAALPRGGTRLDPSSVLRPH